ncbi:MAG: type II toxin-antitoxin system HicB family antitoxin [Oscillospiraceae bacterium]|jgi:predicted RNase H-like HicB family nuclease|nr:type II toxin-antitoxin system HicB family antitoxin [Oscillospiraceae bacterium]
MKYAYQAIFTEEQGKVLVSVPDLKGCFTFGDTLPEAIEMAEDAVSMWLYLTEKEHGEIPEPSRNLTANVGFVSYVYADTDEYRRQNETRAVKKTLTIPTWLNEKALAKNINFSQVLQNALIEQLGKYSVSG